MIVKHSVLLIICIVAVNLLPACSSESEGNLDLSDSEHNVYSKEESTLEEDSIIEESTSEEVISTPITMLAEYYSGEFNTGCNDCKQYYDSSIELEFSVEVEKTTYHCGDTVTLYTLAKNIGSEFMYIPDYGSPTAWLQHTDYVNGKSTSRGYATYRIMREDFPMPEDIPKEKLCESDGTWSQLIVINIPENAIIGTYDIKISSHGYTTIIRDAIEIIN